ncbi:response regulator [Paracoccus sp. CPCC 101403]|uniref:Response regulator n=1 Tax=Paracoccus broussonetiae TaxID=3075834 RepID=A0ABU3EDR1_9RHOB|nr:response regulator [Paracoccus sp. CPCC 101403]MDT1062275.1 response regulator [Paracoccus sp. CPCC 101403]
MAAASLAQSIGQELPFLRRYARALTGSQTAGDNYAAATLEAILVEPGLVPPDDVRVGLFRTFHGIWHSSGQPVETEGQSGQETRAQARLRNLTPNSREALLLHTIEDMSHDQIARIMQVGSDEAAELVAIARAEIGGALSAKVMIIEDETIIAMDLKGIVQSLGHEVTGIARTHKAAIELAQTQRPDLILSDIQLADGSSGVEAVGQLMGDLGDLPVIFITAFPERLLTGERPEPAFLLPKPYRADQVASAVGQAIFFASTEDLVIA